MNVELSGAKWFKSSRSGGGKDCVEVAHLGDGLVGVRDSKDPSGPALVFGAGEWDSFVGRLGRGELG
ncbi:DUF397 domain-containing protein [Nocardia blacklockiae]|uniref:DUF397 domain-containing protein n=1 Tax=Nocardia blacklockiae TaxID=480036 RepID=UPI001894BD04|nr:DUF397 domain-containing protein [Nocardia blacklockiae]MBF6173637.1 DUF397 domain-containing protein [Nocardia blacklockiae]